MFSNAMVDDVVMRVISPQQDRAIAACRSIVVNALDMFRDTSLFDIEAAALAQRAGVSRVSIYNHFGGMRGVLTASAELLRTAKSKGMDVSEYDFILAMDKHEAAVREAA